VTDPGRRDELALRLAEVRSRIAKACEAAGREASELTLVAVTKTRPASDVRLLSELGVTDIGENRDAEAAPKAAECADLESHLALHRTAADEQVRQRGPVRQRRAFGGPAPPDRGPRQGRARAGRVIECLVEVSLDGDRPAAGRSRGTFRPWPRRWRPRRAGARRRDGGRAAIHAAG
jgi:Predicted enzyme with a TIM-barrel fold